MAQLKYYDTSTSSWKAVVTDGVQGATGATGAQGIVSSHGWESGRYYGFFNTGTGSGVPTQSMTNFMRFYVPSSTTFDRIACRTATGFSGTAVVRLGVYNNVNDAPSNVKFDAGTVSCTAASTVYEITINQTLTEGWYWFAFNSQTNATTNNFAIGQTPHSFYPGLWPYGATDFRVQERWQESGVTGAFSTAGTISRNTQMFVVALRKS